MRLLVSLSDEREAKDIKKGLEAENFVVDALDLEETGLAARQLDYDLAIIDWAPHASACPRLLSELRVKNPWLMVFVIISSASPEHRAKALVFGADDCLSEPFSFNEFSGRVHALLRRKAHRADTVLKTGDLELDWDRRTVRRAGRRVDLSPKEFALIAYLMENAGRPLTRAKILDHVWDLSFDPMSNVVDVYVHYLRQKIDARFERRLIRTVRGVGYQVDASD